MPPPLHPSEAGSRHREATLLGSVRERKRDGPSVGAAGLRALGRQGQRRAAGDLRGVHAGRSARRAECTQGGRTQSTSVHSRFRVTWPGWGWQDHSEGAAYPPHFLLGLALPHP